MSDLYSVTKRHTSGLLEGLTTTETTPVPFVVGSTFTAWQYGGAFEVVACDAV